MPALERDCVAIDIQAVGAQSERDIPPKDQIRALIRDGIRTSGTFAAHEPYCAHVTIRRAENALVCTNDVLGTALLLPQFNPSAELINDVAEARRMAAMRLWTHSWGGQLAIGMLIACLIAVLHMYSLAAIISIIMIVIDSLLIVAMATIFTRTMTPDGMYCAHALLCGDIIVESRYVMRIATRVAQVPPSVILCDASTAIVCTQGAMPIDFYTAKYIDR